MIGKAQLARRDDGSPHVMSLLLRQDHLPVPANFPDVGPTKGKHSTFPRKLQTWARTRNPVRRRGNFVTSGGRVPGITLNDRVAFELVEGTL